MWSDRYYYLNIYKSKSLDYSTDTVELKEFLLGIEELELIGENNFKNSNGFPFTDLLLLNASSIDSWSNRDIDPRKTNLITIVFEKEGIIDFEKSKEVFIRIASFLNWKLVNEETDDGIEDFVIWES